MSGAREDTSGPTKQTDNPIKSPYGNSAGPVVDADTMTVAQVVAQLDGSSQFKSLLASADVVLSASETYSVFVPTDGAFSQLAGVSLAAMTSAEKARLVKYHIVKRPMDTDAVIAGGVETLSGDTLNFSFGLNSLPMIGNAIVITQFNANNGVIYTIDNVLLPPKK